MNVRRPADPARAVRSPFKTLASIASGVLLIALVGCGGGGSGGGNRGGSDASTPPPPANASFERFVRDALQDDPSAQPREINDVPFTFQVQQDTFDDAFPA